MTFLGKLQLYARESISDLTVLCRVSFFAYIEASSTVDLPQLLLELTYYHPVFFRIHKQPYCFLSHLFSAPVCLIQMYTLTPPLPPTKTDVVKHSSPDLHTLASTTTSNPSPPWCTVVHGFKKNISYVLPISSFLSQLFYFNLDCLSAFRAVPTIISSFINLFFQFFFDEAKSFILLIILSPTCISVYRIYFSSLSL